LELSYSCYTFFRVREEISFSWQYSRRGILSKGARVLRWFLQCNPSSRWLLALNMYNHSLFPWLLCSIWPYNCIDYNLLYCCAYSLQISSQCTVDKLYWFKMSEDIIIYYIYFFQEFHTYFILYIYIQHQLFMDTEEYIQTIWSLFRWMQKADHTAVNVKGF